MPASRTASATLKTPLAPGPTTQSREFAINQAWLAATTLAADLVAWLRLLALTGQLANADPKPCRYRLLDVPARLTRSARRRHLRIPATWPWVHDIVAVFARIAAIPLPA